MSAHLDDDDLPPRVSDDEPDSFTVVAQARRFRKRLETLGNAHELVKTMDEALEELGDLSSSVIEPFISEVIAAEPGHRPILHRPPEIRRGQPGQKHPHPLEGGETTERRPRSGPGQRRLDDRPIGTVWQEPVEVVSTA